MDRPKIDPIKRAGPPKGIRVMSYALASVA